MNGSFCLDCYHDSLINTPMGSCDIDDPIFCLSAKETLDNPPIKKALKGAVSYFFGRVIFDILSSKRKY